jgi:hypothetical protein
VELVGSRYQQRIAARRSEMLQIFDLSFTPRQFLIRISRHAVRTGFHRICHTVAKHLSNGVQGWEPALILDCIVQQRGYSLILVAPSFKDKGAYAHQVGNVGDGDAFSGLLVMQPGGELQGGIKSPS